jgi:hypothetical protein
VSGKNVEGSGHGQFQGAIPAIALNDWQIWYMPSYIISSTSQSSVSFLLKLSVCIIHFKFDAQYNNVVLGNKLTYVFCGFFQS